MNIVIDKALVEDLVNTLADYKQALQDNTRELLASKAEAERNQFLTVTQACQLLGGINEDTLLYYRSQGLEYYKKGQKGVWYRKGDILDWLEKGHVNRHSAKNKARSSGSGQSINP